jgi:hypothetical protein
MDLNILIHHETNDVILSFCEDKVLCLVDYSHSKHCHIVSKIIWYVVDAFVASGGIPTSGLGARHVGIVVGTRLALSFGENPLVF